MQRVWLSQWAKLSDYNFLTPKAWGIGSVLTGMMISPNFFQSTWPISDLNTQQISAKPPFDKGCPQTCPKGLNVCVLWVVIRWGLCVNIRLHLILLLLKCAVCVCVGCLNKPLFSLLILAAAACEAWANDGESKRLTCTALRPTLTHSPTSCEEQSEAQHWGFVTLWHFRTGKTRLWCAVVYCVAELSLSCRKTKTKKVRYCWWRNNQNHTAQSDAQYRGWHVPALGRRGWGFWMQLHL